MNGALFVLLFSNLRIIPHLQSLGILFVFGHGLYVWKHQLFYKKVQNGYGLLFGHTLQGKSTQKIVFLSNQLYTCLQCRHLFMPHWNKKRLIKQRQFQVAINNRASHGSKIPQRISRDAAYLRQWNLDSSPKRSVKSMPQGFRKLCSFPSLLSSAMNHVNEVNLEVVDFSKPMTFIIRPNMSTRKFNTALFFCGP